MFPFHNHSGSWLDELCPYRAGRLWAQQASCSPRQLVTLAKVPLLVIVFSVPRTQAAHTESFPPRTKCRHLRFDASIPARPLDTGAPRQSRAHWIRPVIPGRSRSWRLFPRSYVAGRLRRASFLVVSVSCARPRDAEEINGDGGAQSHSKGTDGHHRGWPLCHAFNKPDHHARDKTPTLSNGLSLLFSRPLTDAPDACSCYVRARGGRGGAPNAAPLATRTHDARGRWPLPLRPHPHHNHKQCAQRKQWKASGLASTTRD